MTGGDNRLGGGLSETPATSHTSGDASGHETPGTDGQQVEPSLGDMLNFQTPPSSRAVNSSPRDDLVFPVERMDITPEGVRRNFLQLRDLLNGYVREERSRGVRVRLSYDEEPVVTLSPNPLLLGTTTSPATQRDYTNPHPYLNSRGDIYSGGGGPSSSALSPGTSIPISYEEALRSLPLASSAVATSLAGAGSLAGGFVVPPGAMYPNYSQSQYFPIWPGGYPWQYPSPLNQVPVTPPVGGQGPMTSQPLIQTPVAEVRAETTPSKPYRPKSLECF